MDTVQRFEWKTIQDTIRNDKLFHLSLGGDRKRNQFSNNPSLFLGSKEWLEDKLKEYQKFLKWLSDYLKHEDSEDEIEDFHKEEEQQMKELGREIKQKITLLRFQTNQLKENSSIEFSPCQSGKLYTENQKRDLIRLMDDKNYSYSDLTFKEIE